MHYSTLSGILRDRESAVPALLHTCCISSTQSLEILMFICNQKDAKQCCETTRLNCRYCVSHGPAQCVQPSFMVSQHCLASFFSVFGDKQTAKFHETYNLVKNKLQNLLSLRLPIAIAWICSFSAINVIQSVK